MICIAILFYPVVMTKGNRVQLSIYLEIVANWPFRVRFGIVLVLFLFLFFFFLLTLSCWMSSTNKLNWIFVLFVGLIELVSTVAKQFLHDAHFRLDVAVKVQCTLKFTSQTFA